MPHLDRYRHHAAEAATCAYAPYSQRGVAAVAVLDDGRWVPGVRVENASLPLTIPALTAALVGAQATAGLGAVGALILSRAALDVEVALAAEALGRPVHAAAEDVLRADAPLPAPAERVALDIAPFETPAAGIAAARAAAARAVVPASSFPVGCVVVGADGRCAPGANIEFADWTRGLCAERSALALAASYGVRPAALYLSCLRAPGGTPCGACRQVIAELAPEAAVWIDRGGAPPRQTTPAALLPDAFGSDSLRRPHA